MIIAQHKTLQRLGCGLLVIVLFVVAIALIFYYTAKNEEEKIRIASVVTNGEACAGIGMSILEKGGNAADAAIAALFCEGASMPQSMGLGGGFLLTIYNKTTGEAWSLNARETAPAAATQNMFNGNETLAQTGGLSVAIPGELIGYWYLYERFGGGVPWRDLVQPTIDLCRNGIYVTNFTAGVHQDKKDLLYADPVLRDIFFDPDTNDTYAVGKYIKRLRLAKTLEVIAEEGGYTLHNGSLTEAFVKEIQDKNGIITVEDMKNYRPIWQKPIRKTLVGNKTLYTTPLPGSGVVLSFILGILNDFIDISDIGSVTNYQRMTESFKHGYGKRTLLGDVETAEMNELLTNLSSKSFAEEIRQKIFDNQTFEDPAYYGAKTANVDDHGTAHISVLASNGDAISVTSTINYFFGAGFASETTGIIFNDEMDDFSSPNITNVYDLPPSPANFIVPGKRPLSSMCPTIVLDENKDVVLVVGAGGGSKITSAIAQVIMHYLWYGMDIKTAVDYRRIHHQLIPMQIMFDTEFLEKENVYIINDLSEIGHKYITAKPDGFAAVTSVAKSGNVTAAFDKRRQGGIAYMYG